MELRREPQGPELSPKALKLFGVQGPDVVNNSSFGRADGANQTTYYK
jgi:hypothetical protein|tara:strand:+ start:145 stop:285 length:141 start_codon:yes stop_codon:yes gene_type:complete